jgi:hypothetical protein
MATLQPSHFPSAFLLSDGAEGAGKGGAFVGGLGGEKHDVRPPLFILGEQCLHFFQIQIQLYIKFFN